jgi:hypothetical protein
MKGIPTNPFDRLRGMSLQSGLIVKSLASPPPVTFEDFPPEVHRRVYELLFEDAAIYIRNSRQPRCFHNYITGEETTNFQELMVRMATDRSTILQWVPIWAPMSRANSYQSILQPTAHEVYNQNRSSSNSVLFNDT